MMNIDFEALKNRRVLCAMSGGADSMCMVSVLRENKVEVAAAHFEHGIRAQASMSDAAFVENWCAGQNIPCLIGHGDVPAYAAANRLGIEEAARKLRYDFLREAAERLGCELIATAHNADDNTETMLFNLARGTGSAGLRGIPPQRGNIVRPLLAVSRREIEEYLQENAIAHVEDATNQSDEYSRNLIRHKVVPVLRELNPALNEAARRTAALMRQDDDCLEALAANFLRESFDGESVPLDALNSLHPAVSSRVVRRLAERSLSMEQAEKVLELCRSTEFCLLDIPGQRLRVEKGRLWLRAEEELSMPERALKIGETLEIPESGIKIQSRYTVFNKEINGLFKTYYINCENISGDIVVTGRRAGDKFRPCGRGCTKSLKGLFAETPYTRRQRDMTPVLRDERGILAVCGFPPDERTVCAGGDKAVEIIFET